MSPEPRGTTGEHASVRIEMVGGGTDAPATPEVSSRRSRPPLAAIALMVVAVVIGAVLFSRPDRDQAADGTARQAPSAPPTNVFDDAPTTSAPVTTVPSQDHGQEGIAEQEPTVLALALDAAQPGASIEPRSLDTDVLFVDVVEIDGQFLALAQAAASEIPPVYASVDGVNWVELATSLLQTQASEDVTWRRLITTPTGVAALGFVAPDGDGSEQSTLQFIVATSDTGVVWESISPASPAGNSGPFAVPIGVLPSGVISAAASDAVLLEDILRFDEVIVATPTFDNICEAYGGSANASSITECGSFSVVNELETAGAISNELAGVGLGALDLNNSGPAFGECVAVAADLTVPGFMMFGPEGDAAFAFAGTGGFPEFTVLADGRIAVVDRGTVGAVASCDAAGGDFRRDGGVVLVDFNTVSAVTLQVPTAFRDALAATPTVDFLGEFVVDDTRSHLLLVIAGDLWSIDTRTGRWTELTPDFVASSGFGRSQFILSTSGRRLYRIDLDGLTAINLSSSDAGSLTFNVANWPIETDQLLLSDVRDATFLSATDDVVFFLDGSAMRTLAVPS